MDNRIQPDFSVGMYLGEEKYLVDRVYDQVHVFSWLGHGILKIVTQEGIAQWHLPQADAEIVADAAEINVNYRKEIAQSEYEVYLRYLEQTMDTDWLDD
jgi:hypothetical protein